MKQFLLFFLFLNLVFLASKNLYSQNTNSRENYELLWEISGNGLTKPSYIFGTMHLADNRVFDFSDSVILKIQACEGFALEINPDSFVQIISTLILQSDNEIEHSTSLTYSLKDKLSTTEYKTLEKKLYAETGMKLNNIKDQSPKKIIKLLEQSSLKSNNDKPTFLDVYLYKIALGENKKIDGLESIEGQLEALDYSKDEDDLLKLKQIVASNDNIKLNELIDYYWQGDINKINKFTLATSIEHQNILYKRNTKMVERIQVLSGQHSFFYAVGAAHLPGDNGIIALLKNMGYTIRLVKPTFTELAKQYKEKPILNPWLKNTYKEDGYEISFPKRPAKYATKSKQVFSMHLYPDFTTGLFYFAMSVPTSESDREINKTATQSIIDKIRDKKTNTNITEKSILNNNVNGKEIEYYSVSEKLYYKIQITEKNHLIFVIFIAALKKESFQHEDVKKYYSSFKILDVESTLQHITSAEGAYELYSEGTFKELYQDLTTENKTTKVNFYTGNNFSNGDSYLVGYYTLPQGTYIEEDSTYLDYFLENFNKQLKTNIISTKPISLQGYNGIQFTLNNNKSSLLYYGRIYIREARPYLILMNVANNEPIDPEANPLFNSFKFIDYQTSKWEKYISLENNFELTVPSFTELTETDSNFYNVEEPINKTFNFLDENTSISYVVSLTQYSPYYYIPEVEFYNELSKKYIFEGDSLLSDKKIILNNIEGHELLIKKSNVDKFYRILIIPNNNSLMGIASIQSMSNITSKESNDFFNSLKFIDSKSQALIFQSKSNKIIEDMTSNDTLISTKALDMLWRYRFEKKDLPLLYSSLKKEYPSDTLNGYEDGIRRTLFHHLGEIKENSSVGFIKDIYPTLYNYPYIQTSALKALLDIATDESLENFLTFISNKKSCPDIAELPYGFFNTLEDSLELNQKLFPKLFPVYHNKIFRNSIYKLSEYLLDSNSIESVFFTNHIDSIMYYNTLALNDIGEYTYDENYMQLFYSLPILKRFPNNIAVVKHLSNIANSANTYLAFQALTCLINNHSSINSNTLERFASDQEYRIKLYSILSESDQLNLFPKKWMSQEHIAESDMLNVMNGYDEDFLYEKTVLIKSKIIKNNGTNFRYYLFKTQWEGDWYVGISGPYPINKKEIVIYPEKTLTNYELLGDKSVEEHFRDLLK